MISREILVKKIEILPPYLLQEVADYIEFVEYKKYRKNNMKISDITLASERCSIVQSTSDLSLNSSL